MLVCLRRGMSRTLNVHLICWILILGLIGSSLPTSTKLIQSSSAELPNHIIISEILVSPNNEEYGGIDWNGDGKYGPYNDMFVELYNPTENDVNISNWILDDIQNEGSPSCSIGWDTVIPAGEYMVFYRVNTGLEFDFWAGDTVHISDSSGNFISHFCVPSDDISFLLISGLVKLNCSFNSFLNSFDKFVISDMDLAPLT